MFLFESASAKRLANLPVMAKWVDDAANPPTVRLIGNLVDDSRARAYCEIEDRIWIIDYQNHARCASAQAFRAEVLVIWGFVCYPET